MKQKRKTMDIRVPIPVGEGSEPEGVGCLPANVSVEFLLDAPILSPLSEREELHRTFVKYLGLREQQQRYIKRSVRASLNLRDSEELAETAAGYGLHSTQYAVFQLLEQDPRGIYPGMPFTLALRRYRERINLLQEQAK